MCGFVAYHSTRQTIEPALLDAMTDSLAHRGPDDRGIFIGNDGLLGLGHRRLSILDLSAAGHQPMSDATGRYTIVYNGEVYGFKDTRSRLQESGHRFESNSDTEVILEAFAEWGAACLDHLDGMFAFAIWDSTEKKLFAARDRIGIKPLYYYWDGTTAILTSQLRAILAHPRVAREIDLSAARDFLVYGYVPDPKAILRNIRKLPPGHSLSLSDRHLKTECYWDVDFADQTGRSQADWQDEILAQLDRSVSEQLVSDVPLGAFLSGGVDSSAVVSSMVGSGVEKPSVFCIGFDDARFSELPYARHLCETLGIDLIEKIVTDERLEQDLAMLAEVYDEPFGDQSALPTYHLCKTTRQHVKVALSGDGGDENFAGYRVQTRAYDRITGRKRWRPKMLLRRIRSHLREPGFGYPDPRSEPSDPLDYFCWQSGHWTPEEVARLMPGDHQGEDPFWAYKQQMQPELDTISQILRISLKTVLPGRMLTKIDRASMARGLEVRVPLLDHRLVEHAATIPIAMKVRNGKGKYILKKALEPRVPTEILYRPKKGFTPPVRVWLSEPKTYDMFRVSILGNSLIRDLCDSHTLNLFLSSHSKNRDYNKRFWDLIALDRWSRRWL